MTECDYHSISKGLIINYCCVIYQTGGAPSELGNPKTGVRNPESGIRNPQSKENKFFEYPGEKYVAYVLPVTIKRPKKDLNFIFWQLIVRRRSRPPHLDVQRLSWLV